ncbi:hypothetical protein EMCRGX_G001368 [Ephydatia muelleri]
MDGQHVQKSPCDIDVRMKYSTLCNAEQVINCNCPKEIAIHDSGDIYVASSGDVIAVFDQSADNGNHCIQKLTTGGQFLQRFGQLGSGQGQFNHPVSVIVDQRDRLIISDVGNQRVVILNQAGSYELIINGNSPHGFKRPFGLSLDCQGNICITVCSSNTIKVFTPEGTYVRSYGDVKAPSGIVIDEEGYSLVNECDGNCLSIFDPHGNKVHTVGNLKKPRGVMLDPKNGNLYVANYGANTVLKFSV